MSNKEVVGQLKGTRNEMDIEWEIADFLSLSAEVDKWYKSPMVFFCDSPWYLRVYPNGRREKSSEGYVGVYVLRGDWGPPVSVTYSLFLKKTDGREELVKKDRQIFEEKDGGWGEPEAIRRAKLVKSASDFMPSGALTVICTLKRNETQAIREDEVLRRAMKDCIPSAEVSTETDVCVGTTKLLSDLKDLVLSGEESDMTVTVQDREFRLHRAIMAARTPVFNAMFKINMKEKATGIVPIEDCDAETFRTFVHYLYTGSEEELRPDNVVRVYEIADKYQVDELKASCLDIMKNTLSVHTFFDTLDLALQHEEQDLIERITDFLSENSSGIMGTEDWESLMRNNTKQISNLLMQAFIRNSRKNRRGFRKMI